MLIKSCSRKELLLVFQQLIERNQIVETLVYLYLPFRFGSHLNDVFLITDIIQTIFSLLLCKPLALFDSTFQISFGLTMQR